MGAAAQPRRAPQATVVYDCVELRPNPAALAAHSPALSWKLDPVHTDMS